MLGPIFDRISLHVSCLGVETSAPIFGIFPHLVLLVTLPAFTPEGIVVGF